jgi:multidrug resistance efflux pump
MGARKGLPNTESTVVLEKRRQTKFSLQGSRQVKTEILESIDHISRDRQGTEGNRYPQVSGAKSRVSLPGVLVNDTPDTNLQGSRSVALAGDDRLLDDTTIDRLVKLLDSYDRQVKGWAEADESSRYDRWPSVMTFCLFGLGIAITAATNYWNYGRQLADHEFVLFNISGAMVFLLSGISLFYDRSVREIGNDRIRKESGRRVEAIGEQVRSMSQLYQRWISDWKGQKSQLLRLEAAVRDADSQSVAAELKAKQCIEESDALGRQRDELLATVESLKEQAVQLQADADYAKLKLCGIDSEIEAKREHLADLRNEREKVRREILELEEKSAQAADAFETTRNEYEANLRQFNRDLQSIERRIEKLTSESHQLQGECEGLIRQKSDMEADLDSLKAEFDRNIEIQTQTLASVTSSLEDCKAERALLEEAIAVNRKELDGLKADQASLIDTIAGLTASREQCEASLKSLIEETSQKRELNELLETQTKVLVEDRELRCNKLDKSISELDGTLSTRRGELLVATEQFERVHDHHRQLAAEIDHLTRVKTAMETSVNELTDRLANKSSDFKRKTLQVHELANRLEALTETVNNRAVGPSAPVTISPVSGAISPVREESARSVVNQEQFDTQSRGRATGGGLHGPHWSNDQIQKIFDRIDDLDELTEEGLD